MMRAEKGNAGALGRQTPHGSEGFTSMYWPQSSGSPLPSTPRSPSLHGAAPPNTTPHRRRRKGESFNKPPAASTAVGSPRCSRNWLQIVLRERIQGAIAELRSPPSRCGSRRGTGDRDQMNRRKRFGEEGQQEEKIKIKIKNESFLFLAQERGESEMWSPPWYLLLPKNKK